MLADVVLKLEDGAELNAHRIILTSRCPFFHAILAPTSRWPCPTDSLNRRILSLPHISIPTMRLVLRYIYADPDPHTLFSVGSDCTSVSQFIEFVTSVLAAANELLLDRLCDMCGLVLYRTLNTTTMLPLLNLADLYHAAPLKSACLTFIAWNLETACEARLFDSHPVGEELMGEIEGAVRELQARANPVTRGPDGYYQGVKLAAAAIEEGRKLQRKQAYAERSSRLATATPSSSTPTPTIKSNGTSDHSSDDKDDTVPTHDKDDANPIFDLEMDDQPVPVRLPLPEKVPKIPRSQRRKQKWQPLDAVLSPSSPTTPPPSKTTPSKTLAPWAAATITSPLSHKGLPIPTFRPTKTAATRKPSLLDLMDEARHERAGGSSSLPPRTPTTTTNPQRLSLPLSHTSPRPPVNLSTSPVVASSSLSSSLSSSMPPSATTSAIGTLGQKQKLSQRERRKSAAAARHATTPPPLAAPATTSPWHVPAPAHKTLAEIQHEQRIISSLTNPVSASTPAVETRWLPAPVPTDTACVVVRKPLAVIQREERAIKAISEFYGLTREGGTGEWVVVRRAVRQRL
ncbi:hypothetical protein DFS34DRAFT_622836 [Phlyctochytrium arcticum]|nr:hypothetical protein DFS34DRAFT_622836 [Phlyctochytrium arcticum]